ncbi:hypothetical protein HBE96_23065 [Clostridium sp. P21]|uniref:Uncharacterized protein n=1 Tax=Clostridium muellerianum TaxID=2716538 RepID=A0A7Y0HR55_9CLOT|nr:hypothetical protein [Clostridium muellerianum]NMM65462.1 hypothetical protein [Clostridium muellerianum]
MQWASQLEEIQKVKAKERSQANLIQNSDVETLPPREQGKTRDIVAKESGFGSGKQYDKAKYIYENGSEELIKQLDEKQLSIDVCINNYLDYN